MFLPGHPGSSFSVELTESVTSLISVSSLVFNSIAPLPKRKRLLTRWVIPSLTAVNLIQVFNINELSGQLGKTEHMWQRGSIVGLLDPRPEGCTFISPTPGHGSSPMLLEEPHSGWNAELKCLVLVAGGQMEVEISQRIIFFFLLVFFNEEGIILLSWYYFLFHQSKYECRRLCVRAMGRHIVASLFRQTFTTLTG